MGKTRKWAIIGLTIWLLVFGSGFPNLFRGYRALPRAGYTILGIYDGGGSGG